MRLLRLHRTNARLSASAACGDVFESCKGVVNRRIRSSDGTQAVDLRCGRKIRAEPRAVRARMANIVDGNPCLSCGTRKAENGRSISLSWVAAGLFTRSASDICLRPGTNPDFRFCGIQPKSALHDITAVRKCFLYFFTPSVDACSPRVLVALRTVFFLTAVRFLRPLRSSKPTGSPALVLVLARACSCSLVLARARSCSLTDTTPALLAEA